MKLKFNSKLSGYAGLGMCLLLSILLLSCNKEKGFFDGGFNNHLRARDTNYAPRVFVDRFSDSAGILFKRSDAAHSFPMPDGFPAPNAPINFDAFPFLVHGFDTKGKHISYYNLDAHTTGAHTDVIYHFFRASDTVHRLQKQLSIVNSLPGEAAYNDFWQVVKVIVPDKYVENSITSEEQIFKYKLPLIPTNTILNCPIVPEGSKASLRVGGGSTALVKGWYKDKIFFYFNFNEAPLIGTLTAAGADAPTDDIYVFFTVNPNLPNGGPGSGFERESGTDQEHNLVPSLPGDPSYSSLWSVSVLDNAFFNSVKTEDQAKAHILAPNVALVNCPVVALH